MSTNPGHIMDSHHCEHLKSCTTNFKHGWKSHIGKTKLQKNSMFFTDTVFNIMYFITKCVNNVSNFAFQQTDEMRTEICPRYTHYHYKYTF